MGLMTEQQVRSALGDADLGATRELRVPEGTIVTPSARAWLVDQRVDLVIGERRQSNLPPAGAAPGADRSGPRPQPAWRPPASGSGQERLAAFRREQGIGAGPQPAPVEQPVSALPEFVKPDHYSLPDGSEVTDKPEHLTALAGNMLVAKDHPLIRLRGQLDGLEAQVISAQCSLKRLGLTGAVADLGSVLEVVKQIMRSEVLGVRFEVPTVLDLTWDEIRHVSHHPEETFGIPHFFTSVDDGEAVATLNVLRTKVREVELAAYEAFKRPDAPPRRQDLIQALNRLSSACYIMMFRAKVGWYR